MLVEKITHWVKQNRGFIIFILAMSVFRSVIADWNSVPTGSMQPTIVEGDRILVNKMAYDLRLPFSHVSLWHRADPKRGDIIIFDSEQADKRLVKRVIGIPGDTLGLNNNRIMLNDRPVTYRLLENSAMWLNLEENLPGMRHRIRIHRDSIPYYANFNELTVPEGYYLVLGDNRDRSADSRMIGLVPRNEIVGRSKRVILSLNYDHYFT